MLIEPASESEPAPAESTPLEPAPTADAAGESAAAALVAVENDPVEDRPIEEIPVVEIILRDLPTPRRVEFSGLAWYGDNLLLLTQYPQRVDDLFFYVKRDDIVQHLTTGRPQRVRVHPLPVRLGDLTERIIGFEGFEAVAISGEQVYFTVESRSNGRMAGHLVTGEIAPDMRELRINAETMASITPQANFNNAADEAIVLGNGELLTIFELNDVLVNFSPAVHRFGLPGLEPLGTLSFPHVAYRITDATPLDPNGRFWAINAFYPDSLNLRYGLDLLAMRYGQGETHRNSSSVERLIQFQYSPDGVAMVDEPPVYLQLLDDAARNWEGIALLQTPELTGFLLVTDRRPETILGFAEYPLP